MSLSTPPVAVATQYESLKITKGYLKAIARPEFKTVGSIAAKVTLLAFPLIALVLLFLDAIRAVANCFYKTKTVVPAQPQQQPPAGPAQPAQPGQPAQPAPALPVGVRLRSTQRLAAQPAEENGNPLQEAILPLRPAALRVIPAATPAPVVRVRLQNGRVVVPGATDVSEEFLAAAPTKLALRAARIRATQEWQAARQAQVDAPVSLADLFN